MDNVKNDEYYINKIYEEVRFINDSMTNINQDIFDNDKLLQNGMMFSMVQISENAKSLSKGYKEEHSNIPWSDIVGLRNRIVHDYGNVDLSIVYDTLKNDIPDLLRALKENSR